MNHIFPQTQLVMKDDIHEMKFYKRHSATNNITINPKDEKMTSSGNPICIRHHFSRLTLYHDSKYIHIIKLLKFLVDLPSPKVASTETSS